MDNRNDYLAEIGGERILSFEPLLEGLATNYALETGVTKQSSLLALKNFAYNRYFKKLDTELKVFSYTKGYLLSGVVILYEELSVERNCHRKGI